MEQHPLAQLINSIIKKGFVLEMLCGEAFSRGKILKR